MDERRQLWQIYGIVLKEKMYSLGMRQTSRNRYIVPLPPGSQEMMVKKYKVMECFDLKFVPIGH